MSLALHNASISGAPKALPLHALVVRLVPADLGARNEAAGSMAASFLELTAVAPGRKETAGRWPGDSVGDRRGWAKPANGTRARIGWQRLPRGRAKPAARRWRTPRPEPAVGRALGQMDRTTFALTAAGCGPVAYRSQPQEAGG